MATISTNSSPALKGLKKVFSDNRRSSEQPSDSGPNGLRADSVDALNLENPVTRRSSHSSPSREGSFQSTSSGMRKLIPGHAKRRRRKVREEQLRVAAEEVASGSQSTLASLPAVPKRNPSDTGQDGENSLLTDDSDVETPPPLISRESHIGYLTASNPLISKGSTSDPVVESKTKSPSTEQIPTLVEPDWGAPSPSPKTAPVSEPNPVLPSVGLTDKADSLRPDSRRSSVSKIRGKSPVRRFRDVFSSKSGKSPTTSPRTSPERTPIDSPIVATHSLSRESTTGENNFGSSKDVETSSVRVSPDGRALTGSVASLSTEQRPLTPPTSMIGAPTTTITPPTPTDNQFGTSDRSQPSGSDSPLAKNDDSGVIVSPSGNMISHRRARSASSNTHQPSKLSNSMTVPLTPAIEENRTPSGQAVPGRTPSGSFFSSWVSAAQNAASSISNLTGQSRSRSGTNSSDPTPQLNINGPIEEEQETSVPDTPKKQLAIETLGSGDLNFGHLGLETDDLSQLKTGSLDTGRDLSNQRDENSAKMEDILAKRAVSAAYEKPSDVTPVAEIQDPLQNIRHAQTFSGAVGGDQTPPNGSIFESETGSIRRNNSVRSKLINRRSRGSSSATGQSAIGAMIGASTATLANPATGPRIPGFAMAPKQRNRNYHQLFRSVPEDDYLIEDYSCALQREILLAGRIYISEGHICFSSNILGWVTTLVISFEEVVSIEKENTALVIPNAIAIQTLHARHTFRSLLSREATYDLLIGIWKVSHPASFQKSVNGKALAATEAKQEVAGIVAEATGAHESEESTEDSDSEEDDGSTPSLPRSSASIAGSDVENKTLSRKVSMMNGSVPATTPPGTAAGAVVPGDVPPAVANIAGVPDAANDFPGPSTHAPTECTDSATHYEKIIKDEVIHAPLGKVYSLLYGPQSGVFVRKYLVDDCKCLELIFEDDKKGLNNEIKSRQYTYIKPLGGSIGPKQTKCITTENLDVFDLEKAITVTCTTQTPDVPSGSAFSTKTRYCLTWAPGNATRLQMNCTIEWTAKSWLKGPIEKGANDGQQQYGDGLVKVLKAAVGRPRGVTTASKVSKAKKRRKGEKKEKEEKTEAELKKEENWGLLEPLRGVLGPIVGIFRPFIKTEFVVGLLFIMVMILWFRGGTTSLAGSKNQLGRIDRHVAYEELWRQEESELWNWLESRAGIDRAILGDKISEKGKTGSKAKASKERQKVLKGKNVEAKLHEEKMSEREMTEAIRVTKERLEVLEDVVNKKKASS